MLSAWAKKSREIPRRLCGASLGLLLCFFGARSQQSLIDLPQADNPEDQPSKRRHNANQYRFHFLPGKAGRSPCALGFSNVRDASLTGDRVAPGTLCHRPAYSVA
jgi:hypothetical protein